MPDALELICWVLDDPFDRVFSVEIPNTKTVAVLKDVIKDKKKHAFKNVDADALDVWNVGCHLPTRTPTLTSLTSVRLKSPSTKAYRRRHANTWKVLSRYWA